MAGGQDGRLAETPCSGESGPREDAFGEWEALTLKTPCECGHTRKSHRGLRMDAAGSCLECACEEFKRLPPGPLPYEQVIELLHTGLAQAEQLRELLATLRVQLEPEQDRGRRRRIPLAPRRSHQHGH
jgi:hypothetical protein